MKSYFKFLMRNSLYSAVEILGLSVALCFVILLAAYARTEFGVGTRQRDAKNIYAIGMGSCTGMTLGTGEEFFPGIPEIKSWTRIASWGDADIMVGEDYYSSKVAALDTNFLKFFDYRVTGCDAARILSGADEALVSESFARKAFGTGNPVGKSFTLSGTRYTISGTIEDFGPFDVFSHYDIFLSMKVMDGMLRRMDNFGAVQTFLTLAPGTDPDAVAGKLLDKYIGYWGSWYHRDSSGGSFLYGSTLTRLDKLYFTDLESYSPLRKGDRKVVEILLLVALVLLISAVFNYINLTVAQTGKRAKEMATRRLLGESPRDIVFRYIAESFVFTAGCFVLGCIMAACLKESFAELLDTEPVLAASASDIAVCLLLLAFLTLSSALLPAALVSRFRPVDVVKGSFRLRSKMVFSKVFIVCQNVISTSLIAVALTMLLQMSYMMNMPTGYETQDVLSIQTRALGYNNSSAQAALEERIAALPQVQKVGRYCTPPFACGSNGVHVENEKLSWMRLVQIDSAAFNILGFKVLEQYREPSYGDCWFTPETVSRYGVSEEKPYAGDGQEYKCHGIIDDFMTGTALDEPMDDSHKAVMLRDCSGLCMGFVIKTVGDHSEAIEAVRRVWTETAREYLGVPSEPDGLEYIGDYLSDSLTGKRHTMTLVITFMLIAILISALGLFAMALYYTGQQAREIAVRKVFGSEVNAAAMRLSKSFAIMTLAAAAIAVPICIWAMRLYLNGFYSRIDFPWWVIPVSALLTCAISFLSIVSQTLKTAHANPVETLKQQD